MQEKPAAGKQIIMVEVGEVGFGRKLNVDVEVGISQLQVGAAVPDPGMWVAVALLRPAVIHIALMNTLVTGAPAGQNGYTGVHMIMQDWPIPTVPMHVAGGHCADSGHEKTATARTATIRKTGVRIVRWLAIKQSA